MAFYEHHSLFLNVLQQQPIKMVKLTYFQLHLDPLQNIKEHQTPHSPPPPPPDETAQRLGRAILDLWVGKRV